VCTGYNKRIADPSIPVVNVGNGQHPTYLPAEVCVVMPGQTFKSALDRNQTQQMINFAVRKPEENAKSIAGDGLRIVGLSSPGNEFLVRHLLDQGWSLGSTTAHPIRGVLAYLSPRD
jgi:hypothetical protein